FLELLIDVNPYSLKAACGRMLAFFASADGVGDELGEFERGAQRLGFAANNNRLCNLESKPFFAIMSYDLLNFFLAGLCQPFCSGYPAAGVHTHIKRTFPHKGKPSRRIVNLWGGDAQVQQYAVDLLNAKLLQVFGHVTKPAVHDPHPRIAFTQGLCDFNCLRILVEDYKRRIRPKTLQQQAAVATATKCSVHVNAVERRHAELLLRPTRTTLAE